MRSFDRREFLKLAGAAGLSVVAPMGRKSAHAQEVASRGPRWIFIHAGGGWDPTSLCDPKGRRNEEEEDPMNLYLTDDIGTAGNIRYAPVGWNREFFDKHHSRVLVLNGVDTQTNSHDAGTRHVWSGKLGAGHPALAALISGVLAEDLPMAFLSNGGFDTTEGLIAPTRTGNIAALARLAYPNATNGDPAGEKLHTDATYKRIIAAQERRRDYLQSVFSLPRGKRAISQLFTARLRENEVGRLREYLPESFENDQIKRQAQVALAAFRANIAQTANLAMGGFDTHGNHDAAHIPRLATLLQGVDFIWEEAERQQVADELVVVVGSDFGRTPGYNSGNGKDHWSVTSMLLMGQGIVGNRVIGKTTERHAPFEVDPGSLEPVDSGGLRIRPGHVHRQLRELAGIHDDPVAEKMFPLLGVEDLRLLG